MTYTRINSIIFKKINTLVYFHIFISMEKQKYITEKASAEIKAMNWLQSKDNLVSYVKEEYEYNPYDGVLTSGSTKYLAEIKVRKDYSHEEIQALGGTFLEFDKLKSIIKYKRKHNNYEPILYLVFLKDRLNIYHLNEDPNQYTWDLDYLNDNDYDRTKVWKHIAKLNPNTIIKTIKYK